MTSVSQSKVGRVALMAVGLVAACASDSSDVPAVPSVERSFQELELELEWRRGGVAEDTVLYNPWKVRASDRSVAVLDHGGYRIRAFDLETGTLQWSTGRRGEGPMEFSHPIDLLSTEGGWTVWDRDTARLTHLTSRGRLDKEQLVLSDVAPHRFCALPSGKLGTLVYADEAAAGILTEEGRLTDLVHLPWTEMRELDPMQRQIGWATDGAGTCVALLTFGSGFASFDEDGFGVGHPYIEPSEPPSVTITQRGQTVSTRIHDAQATAKDGLVYDGQLWLLFAGGTEDAGRLIDVYEVTTGAYLHSYRLPFYGASSMARMGGQLFLTREIDGYPVLEAYGIR